MIKVTVKAILDIVRLIGGREQTLTLHEQATVLDVLDKLAEAHGKPLIDRLFTDNHELKKGMIVMVNGQNIYFLNQLETMLSDGDEVLLFPPTGGG